MIELFCRRQDFTLHWFTGAFKIKAQTFEEKTTIIVPIYLCNVFINMYSLWNFNLHILTHQTHPNPNLFGWSSLKFWRRSISSLSILLYYKLRRAKNYFIHYEGARIIYKNFVTKFPFLFSQIKPVDDDVSQGQWSGKCGRLSKSSSYYGRDNITAWEQVPQGLVTTSRRIIRLTTYWSSLDESSLKKAGRRAEPGRAQANNLGEHRACCTSQKCLGSWNGLSWQFPIRTPDVVCPLSAP